MPTIQIEFEVSRESLLKAIEELGPMELDQLVSEVLALQARRTTAALPSGIVSWYKAEDNADDAVGNNHGTAHALTYGPGVVGQAFQFDGGGCVRVPDAPSLNSAAIAVEAWVKSSGLQGRYRYLVGKGVDPDAASYALYSGHNGGLFFYVYDGKHFVLSPDAGPGIWDGKWHHVAGTFDGATVRLYVDGKQVGNGRPAPLTINYNLPGGNDLLIGNVLSPGGPWGFMGSIDELSIYNRALSASEIQTIYNAGSAGKSNGSASKLAFSADGLTLASGSGDTSVLLWSIMERDPRQPPPDLGLVPQQLEKLWDDLASEDASRAWRAVCILAKSPKQAVPWLKEYLKPLAAADLDRIKHLVTDLDSDQFAVRQQAARELEKLVGERAQPAMRKVLEKHPSLEVRRRLKQLLQKLEEPVRAAGAMRELRSLEILEHTDSAEARAVLRSLAEGPSDARLTREAKAALDRRDKTVPSK